LIVNDLMWVAAGIDLSKRMFLAVLTR